MSLTLDSRLLLAACCLLQPYRLPHSIEAIEDQMEAEIERGRRRPRSTTVWLLGSGIESSAIGLSTVSALPSGSIESGEIGLEGWMESPARPRERAGDRARPRAGQRGVLRRPVHVSPPRSPLAAQRRGHLEDLGSSNGTFVRLRATHPLAPGDLIRLGDVLLRFEQS
jgi:hypothetical protein